MSLVRYLFLTSSEHQWLRHFEAKAKSAENLYYFIDFFLWCLLCLLLESNEEHYYVPIVEDEEYTEDVAAMFGTEFKNLVTQVFDEFGIDSLLCLQHINDIEPFTGFGIAKSVNEVFEVVFVCRYGSFASHGCKDMKSFHIKQLLGKT